MKDLPISTRLLLKRLSRRLTSGLIIEIWPKWAASSLLAAGVITLLYRMFVPGASGWVQWLWTLPVMSIVPAAIIYWKRAYKPAEIVAIADSLSGGHGTLISLYETRDPAWSNHALPSLVLPRLRVVRRLLPV